MARPRRGWRGPEYEGEFPTLGYVVADFIQAHCVIPDRAVRGQPFLLSDEQLEDLLWQFRLWPDAVYDVDRPAAPFVYNGALIVRAQKWGKAPYSSSRICAQAIGPVLFDGWDAYGEPVGRPWTTPHIQVAAVAEDQTANIWRALRPMIEEGPLAELIPDTGLDRMNLRGGGIIERVSSNALTRLGARLTYLEVDQPESMTKTNGGDKLWDTLLRNCAGMGGRWAATGNAHDPAERSVQQVLIESKLDDVYINYPEPPKGSWKNKRDRRRILRHSYKGSPWVDVDRVEADCDRLAAKGEAAQAERFFGNRVASGADKAFDIELYKTLAAEVALEPGRLSTLGFDGSLTQDVTGLVATDVELGFQFVVNYWRRPPELDEDDEWTVPIEEVDEAVDWAFAELNVWRLNGDPPHYQSDLNRWAGKYGDDKVIRWWTNNRPKMAHALRDFRTDMRPGVMSHGPGGPAGLAGHEALLEHVANAVKRPTNIRDEEDGTFLWLIGKPGAKSPLKIDLAMAAVLSWIARGDAIRDGALNKKTYSRASW